MTLHVQYNLSGQVNRNPKGERMRYTTSPHKLVSNVIWNW